MFSSPGTISHANCSQFPHLAVAELRFTPRDGTTNTRALKLQEHLERVSSVSMDIMDCGQRAVAAASIDTSVQ